MLSSCLVVVSAVLAFVANASDIGDEAYGNVRGKFYVWTSIGTGGALSIVDPTTSSITKTIPIVSSASVPAPIAWGDAAFIRDTAQINNYAFIADSGNNMMYVYDTVAQSLMSKVSTGKKPVHVYVIPPRDEVWAHLDNDGSFDVFSTSTVRYRSSSAVGKDVLAVAGHGKLLYNPNLERAVYSTNVMKGAVTKIDSLLRIETAYLTIANATTPYPCGGTHGIAFSSVDNSLYVECTNPSSCVSPFNNPATCTGSLWQIDVTSFSGSTQAPVQLGLSASTPKRGRLTSPYLSAKFGTANFGIHGASYASPEEQFVVVCNKNLNVDGLNQYVVHILKPVKDALPLVLEVLVGYKPGGVVFYPKDPSIVYGADPNPGNYWAVFSLESSDANSGMAFLDINTVVQAFAAGKTMLEASAVQYVVVGPGSVYRPIKRGLGYVATFVWDAAASPPSYSKLALVNVLTRTVQYLPLAGLSKILWVPDTASPWSASLSAQGAAQDARVDALRRDALSVGGVALGFALAVVCALAALAVVVLRQRARGRASEAVISSVHGSHHQFESLGGKGVAENNL